MRDSPPSEEDARQIQITAERLASSSPRTITLHPSPEEDILSKIKAAAGELKDINTRNYKTG